MILVTGATGNVGSAVVRELRERGEPVRAFVRDRAKGAAMLGNGVELAVGDFEHDSTVRAAVAGVDRVFLASADGPDKVAHETVVIDAAAATGVRMIVKCSAIGAEVGSRLPPFDWNGRIEEHLRASGVPFVMLRAGFFMSNLFASADQIRATGKLLAPVGDGSLAMIDPRDVGLAAATVLTGDGRQGQTYVLTGPAAISYGEIAAALAAATGREIAYVDVPPEALRQGLVEAHMPGWLVTHLDLAFGLVRRGALAGTTDTFRQMTGRDPDDFAHFARDYAAAFGG